jgi:hypothetical protein
VLGDVIIFTPLQARPEIQQILLDMKQNFVTHEKASRSQKAEVKETEEKCDECKMNVNISRRGIRAKEVMIYERKTACLEAEQQAKEMVDCLMQNRFFLLHRS